jgi:hypothetical protein
MRHIQVLLLLVLATFAAYAQITGDLVIKVSDASGAVVPSAKISVKSLATGAVRTMETDSAGSARVAQLQSGSYEIRVEASGFATAVTNATVNTGAIFDVPVVLEVRGTTEEVVVTDAPPLLTTTTSQLQTSTDSKSVIDLPLNGTTLTIAGTTPGVIPVTPRNPFLGLGSYNSNGGRGRANNITLDNSTATDVSTTGGAGLGTVPIDAIKEVNVISNNFSAEYGRNSSSQFQILTKSGTNEFHGVLRHFLRNSAFNARDYFDRTGKAAPLRDNNWSAQAGGAIVKNKLFYFGTYEEQKIRGLGGTRTATVPTPAQASSITSQASAQLMQQLQVPTSESGTITNAAPLSTDSWAYSGRIDWVMSEKDTIFGRYGINNSKSRSAGLTFISSNLPTNGASSTSRPQNANITWTRTVSPTFVNTFLAAFGRSNPNFTPLADFGGPEISFLDGTSAFGIWSGLPQGRTQNTFEYRNDSTWVKDSHTLKFGYSFNRIQANSVFDANVRGTFTFSNFAAFAAGNPAAYSQRFGNSIRGNRVSNHYAYLQDDWKVSPTLTVNLGLRLEVAGGVTEVNGLLSNLNLNGTAPLGGAGTGPLGSIDVNIPAFNSLYNWAPRLGFAWKPENSQFVVRGGYGMAYDFIFLNPITNLRFAPPLMYQFNTAVFTGQDTYANLVAGTSQFQQVGRATVGTFGTTVRNFGAFSPVDQGLRAPQTHQWSLTVERTVFRNFVARGSYVGTKTNFLQRSRPINLVRPGLFTPPTTQAEEDAIRASGAATALNATLNPGPTVPSSSRLDPRFNGVTLVDSSANSNYHGLQLWLERRFSGGYSFSTAYTWSKSIDDVSDVLNVVATDTPAQQDPRNNRDNRGPSGFDVTHRMVITHNWELPFFATASNPFLKHTLGGWQFSGIQQFQSGFPINLLSGARTGFGTIADPTLLGGGGAQRPNLVGPLNLNFTPNPGAGANNPNLVTGSGLAQPFIGNLGTLGRNVVRMNGLTMFDWTLAKNFQVTEGTKLNFQAQFYNMFNNTQFSRPGVTLSAPATFGYYQDTDTNARSVTLALRFIW